MGLELRNIENVTAPNALEVFIGILAVICAPSSCQFAPQARFSSPGRLCCSILRPGCLHFAPQAQKSREGWIFAPSHSKSAPLDMFSSNSCPLLVLTCLLFNPFTPSCISLASTSSNPYNHKREEQKGTTNNKNPKKLASY